MAFDPQEKARSLYQEFKAFAFKGNVVDLAVGVVIGAAFAKITESLVKNIVMPIIGLITPGKLGYEGWYLEINGQRIPYGHFLADVLNFLLIAFVLFLFIAKFLAWLQ